MADSIFEMADKYIRMADQVKKKSQIGILKWQITF